MQADSLLQDFLDDLSASVLTDDWDRYAAGVALPFQLVTDRATITVATEEQLREGFDAFVDMLRSQGVTDYIRSVRSAFFIGATSISGVYETETLARGKRVAPPFRSRIVMVMTEGRWKATSIANTLSNPRWPVLIPTVDEETL